jgi:hypothetical protein
MQRLDREPADLAVRGGPGGSSCTGASLSDRGGAAQAVGTPRVGAPGRAGATKGTACCSRSSIADRFHAPLGRVDT